MRLLLKKMSPKLGAITTRMPASSNAQTACSREDPQPKLRSVTRACAALAPGWFSTKSGLAVPSGLVRRSLNSSAP